MLDLLDQVEQNLAVSKIGIQEFAESSNFCNKPLYPRQRVLLKTIFLEELTGYEEDVLDHWIKGGRDGTEIAISPDIRERVEYLRDQGYEHFREIDLVGGRRSSKGFMTGMALGKVMWDTLQLQDPGRFYGIDPDKDIFFSCVAGSEAQAKEFQYADFSSTVESCKAFEPYLAKSLETEFRVSTPEDLRRLRDRRSKGIKLEKDIARLRGKALAANAGTLRGSATMALVIDEMAWMIAGESKASADQVYSAANPSLDQFGKAAIIFCNSSPYSKVGMFYERVQVAMTPYDPNYAPGEQITRDRKNGTPMSMAFQFPSWALFEDYQSDPERRFRKAITVSADWDPDEKNEDGTDKWSPDDKAQILIARSEEASDPDAYKVERRGKFAEVTAAYLNPDMVDIIYMGVPKGKPVIDPVTSKEIREYLQINTNWGAGATNLFKYKAHLDPSSTTAGFGFALGHLELFENSRGETEEHVVFDIIKRWNPKDFPGETIKWNVVINEVIEYCDLFRPYEVTFDQFQSAEPVQTMKYALQERGIEGINVYVKTATLEKNWYRCETFKTAINHHRVHAPNDTEDLELSANELKFLQVKNTGGRHPRVDKQDIGLIKTKDMADCMMEVVDALIGNVIAGHMRDRAAQAVMAGGAPGGFRIGGKELPPLDSLHPNLSGYYGLNKRFGEQGVAYNSDPTFSKGVTGRGRRGINRMSRSRGR